MPRRAPMSFFHTTPLGRIINRLTKDTVDADKNLADFAAFFLRSMLQLISTIVLIGIVTPLALPALLPIMLLFYFLYSYFQVRLLAPVPACLYSNNPHGLPHANLLQRLPMTWYACMSDPCHLNLRRESFAIDTGIGATPGPAMALMQQIPFSGARRRG